MATQHRELVAALAALHPAELQAQLLLLRLCAGPRANYCLRALLLVADGDVHPLRGHARGGASVPWSAAAVGADGAAVRLRPRRGRRRAALPVGVREADEPAHPVASPSGAPGGGGSASFAVVDKCARGGSGCERPRGAVPGPARDARRVGRRGVGGCVGVCAVHRRHCGDGRRCPPAGCSGCGAGGLEGLRDRR